MSCSPSPLRWLIAALVVAALSGCATGPDGGAVDDADLPALTSSPHAGYELRQRRRALSLARQERWAEAAIAWELLVLLRPDVPAYRQRLDEVRRQVEAAAAEHGRRGAAARKRGDLERAAAHYLSVLALQPDDERAADALRAIERERNRRAYLTRSPRGGSTPPADDARPMAPAGELSGADPGEPGARLPRR
ncbi:tetratricopeptide repeat protein [Caldimonas brevitalea]|uniref:Tetratricopeptide repeat protein n=1 Tax=Caldimonas brevitalea TaxID=413882 RepID=A0A0G3BN01_9BURK|nr:tetratricopeptide repeat protein [Caldimonas brevitalea]AKJ29358.1 hypothetical protein AAW51_2667 [Caldimonas brevitalea]